MRYLITILLLLPLFVNATTYYVSNTGSDAANGTSTGTPWQTISKANTVTSNDIVLFKGGDTFTGKLYIIGRYYGSYGTGKATITGFTNITGFSQAGNIWTKSTGVNKNINNVLINGNQAIKGRYPNSGYLTFSSYTGDSILITPETGTPSRVGKEIVVRTATWVIDVTKVSTQSTGTLKVSPKLTYTPALLGNGYFFQNDASFVDSLNEYSFDSTTGVLTVYSTTSPTVYIATTDTLIHFTNKTATLTGINLTGANITAINADTCTGVTISNCTINHSGSFGIKGRKTSNSTIQNDSVLNCLSNSVFLRSDNPNSSMFDTCNSNTINTLYVKNNAVYAGMGISGDSRYIGISVVGNNNKFLNVIGDSTGYIGLRWEGKDTIMNCSYTNHDIVKSDGGGFYTWLGSGFPTNYDSGTYIKNCISANGYGYAPGTTGNVFGVGFYFDDLVRNITMDSCFATNNTHAVFLHNSTAINATHCILDDSLGYALWIAGTGSGSIFKYNVFYQRTSTNPIAYYDNAGLSITSDSNWLGRPTAQTSVMKVVNTTYTFPGTWTSSLGYDSHSNVFPTSVLTNVGTTYYNASLNTVNTTLSGSYLSSRNFGYTGYMYLPAFKAELLFKANFDGGFSTNYSR